MPTYEFKCHSCGARESFPLPIESRDDAIYCERCGRQMTRVYVPVGVVFKGSGFYHTDSRRKVTDGKS